MRNGGRSLTYDQGPDTIDVLVEVGVIGITPQKSDAATTFRVEELAACDELDGLMEEVIALFIPNGPLRLTGMAGHRFNAIEQVVQFDPRLLYNDGIWLSIIQLTYTSEEDD